MPLPGSIKSRSELASAHGRVIHFHYIYGLMEEQVWRGWRNLYGHYLASPGLIYYWQLRHDLFSDRFPQFVASLERPTQRLTVGNLLGQEMARDEPDK